MNEFADPFTGR
jgi:hypothetical protein